jgi:hypothetical protein
MSNKVESFAKTVSPGKITSFIKDARDMADAMEAMVNSTSLENQSMGAAKIMNDYGCL